MPAHKRGISPSATRPYRCISGTRTLGEGRFSSRRSFAPRTTSGVLRRINESARCLPSVLWFPGGSVLRAGWQFDESCVLTAACARAEAAIRIKPLLLCRPPRMEAIRAAVEAVAPEHLLGLLGSSPIPRSFVTSCVCLQLRPLPFTGITRLHQYYRPLRHPKRPGLSLASNQLINHNHRWGFPCCL
jgi:hypothetical protein